MKTLRPTHRFLLATTVLSLAVALPAGVIAAEVGAAPSASASGNETSAASISGVSARLLVGSPVRNGAGEEIGDVHDLIVSEDRRVGYAVVDVGGFLGIGEKRVLVPFEQLDLSGREAVMVSATREDLEARPAFSYLTTNGYRINPEDYSRPAASDDRDRFVAETERQLSDWGRDVEAFAERAQAEGSEAANEASEDLNQAWDTVQQQWKNLKESSADAWEGAKESFDEAWERFQATWNEVDTERT